MNRSFKSLATLALLVMVGAGEGLWSSNAMAVKPGGGNCTRYHACVDNYCETVIVCDDGTIYYVD